MLLMYRDGRRVRTVRVPVLTDADRTSSPSPEAYGRPWSQVPMAEKLTILADEATFRRLRLRDAALDDRTDVSNTRGPASSSLLTSSTTTPTLPSFRGDHRPGPVARFLKVVQRARRWMNLAR